MELSTKILIEEAQKNGYTVDIIDESDNFISITNNNKIEYIKNANMTSKDKYVNVLMMENKFVTNKILDSNGITIPKNHILTSNADFDEVFNIVKDTKIVIKPNKTNFGLGININTYNDFNKFKQDVEYAFKYDNQVLVEEFIEGFEYRFMVINDKCLGVLHRDAANVIGDGVHSIKELVDIKNESDLRGDDYSFPLRNIIIDDVVINYLKSNNLNVNSVINNGEKVYLRKNSNISTGGDSIDLTDDVLDIYKEVAINAAKALDVKVCGIDMIISDIGKVSKHAIIELNFNPAIHIHHYPAVGKSRNIAKSILELLFND